MKLHMFVSELQVWKPEQIQTKNRQYRNNANEMYAIFLELYFLTITTKEIASERAKSLTIFFIVFELFLQNPIPCLQRRRNYNLKIGLHSRPNYRGCKRAKDGNIEIACHKRLVIKT